MNIVFWGSSDFSMPSLELLYHKHNVLAVVTNPDAFCGRGLKNIVSTPIKKFAVEKNIPLLQPCNLKDIDFINKLFSFNADIYVIVSYGMIIPEEIIFYPKNFSINLHASLLPKYRGASPIQQALLNGDEITGNTVQFITKELDKGDIIIQEKVKIEPFETYIELSKKLASHGALLLLEALDLIEKGNFVRIKQDENFSSYTRVIKKESGLINFFDMKAKDIYNRYRAFKLWPNIYAYYRNSKEKVSEGGLKCIFTDIELVQDNGEAGKIIKANKFGLIVATREGSIKINSIKPENKKEMDFLSFINGFRPIEGNFF